MQIVRRGPAQHQPFPSRRTPPRGHRNRNLPGEIAASQRVGIGLNLRQHSLGQQLAAKLARARPQVQQMIRRAQHIRVVLHHQDRVPQVAQLFENMNQPRRVPRMQPDRRLIQHIQRANKPRAQRSGQLNALRLAAGERRSQPVQRQVLQAHRIQKTQPLPHFFQNRPGNLLLHRRQFQRRKKLLGMRNGQRRRLADVLAVNPHRSRLGPAAVARGNPGTPHSRDTCSASRARAACTSCAPSAQKIRRRPRSSRDPLAPRSTISRAASGSSRQGTSSGIPSAGACLRSSLYHGRYLGRFHGSMAPSASVSPLSGITRFRSKSTVLPKPWQRGHAPKGLLKLNRRGSGSLPGRWQLLHSYAPLKTCAACAPPSPRAEPLQRSLRRPRGKQSPPRPQCARGFQRSQQSGPEEQTRAA